jgi:hypothetical protein
MQGLARFAAKGLPAEHGLDPVQFFLVGDRREAHDLPRLLREHVTGEVILMQPVHDQDDGTRQLVVQPAVGCGRTIRWPTGVALATTPLPASAGRR